MHNHVNRCTTQRTAIWHNGHSVSTLSTETRVPASLSVIFHSCTFQTHSFLCPSFSGVHFHRHRTFCITLNISAGLPHMRLPRPLPSTRCSCFRAGLRCNSACHNHSSCNSVDRWHVHSVSRSRLAVTQRRHNHPGWFAPAPLGWAHLHSYI